jgi:hypothetical protein
MRYICSCNELKKYRERNFDSRQFKSAGTGTRITRLSTTALVAVSVPGDSLFAIPTMRAAVPADLHFRNGRCDKNARGGHDGSSLPFSLEFFHLLS